MKTDKQFYVVMKIMVKILSKITGKTFKIDNFIFKELERRPDGVIIINGRYWITEIQGYKLKNVYLRVRINYDLARFQYPERKFGVILLFLQRAHDTATSEEKRYFDSRINFRKFYLEDIIENYTENSKLGFIKHLFYPLLASKKSGINKDFTVNFQNFSKFKKTLYNMGVSNIDVKELESILVNWSYSFIKENYSQKEAIQMKASFENYLDDVYSDNILMKRGILKGIEKGKLEMAKRFREEGVSINIIEKITKLSPEEIEKL